MLFKKTSPKPTETLPENEDLSPEQEEALLERDFYDDHGPAILGERMGKVIFLHRKDDNSHPSDELS
ncbi:MAG: hypothetical protein FJZ63_06930 [Chlamydiae bacterium]|nr:hypothetical protein [Chlamydiota bacterium]